MGDTLAGHQNAKTWVKIFGLAMNYRFFSSNGPSAAENLNPLVELKKWENEPENKVLMYDIVCDCNHAAFIPSKSGMIILARAGKSALIFDKKMQSGDVPTEIECRKCHRILTL